MKPIPSTFRIHRFEVEQVLVPHYRNVAREYIRNAIWWRKATHMEDHMRHFRDYVRWAKEAAADGQCWAKKCGKHFGKRPKVNASPAGRQVSPAQEVAA